MSEYFTNNREVIKELKINTGTTAVPVWSTLCCASDITLNLDTNTDDFYIFCDAIQRHLTTGLNASISTTLKVDAQSAGVQGILGDVYSALTGGDVSVLENIEIKFDLLQSYNGTTLTYQTLEGTANLQIESLGGSAEGSAEIGVTFNLNGTLSNGGSK